MNRVLTFLCSSIVGQCPELGWCISLYYMVCKSLYLHIYVYSRKKGDSPLYWASITVLDCHCAGRPFQRIPLLISSTGPTASRRHQATTCKRLAGNLRNADDVKSCHCSKYRGRFVCTHAMTLYFTKCGQQFLPCVPLSFAHFSSLPPLYLLSPSYTPPPRPPT